MKAIKLLVAFPILTLLIFLTLSDEEAITLEESTGAYSNFLLFSPPSEEIPLKDIFFDQGEFRLREDAKPVLKENAEILMQNPDIQIEIEGRCNSNEYNPDSNLGQKRAESAKSYLTAIGVKPHRMSLRTRCGDDSNIEGLSEHLDPAWQLNRRVHFSRIESEEVKIGLKTTDK